MNPLIAHKIDIKHFLTQGSENIKLYIDYAGYSKRFGVLHHHQLNMIFEICTQDNLVGHSRNLGDIAGGRSDSTMQVRYETVDVGVP